MQGAGPIPTCNGREAGTHPEQTANPLQGSYVHTQISVASWPGMHVFGQKLEHPEETLGKRRENMQTPLRKASDRDLNLRPSYCELTALEALPVCHRSESCQ